MLSDANFGKFTVQTGILFRDSTFVSKVLLNSEVWHSMTKVQIEDLEVIDKILFRNILQAHSKLNLKALMQIRRLMYLWHLLSRDEDELISRVYTAHTNSNNSVLSGCTSLTQRSD